jgi:uncharacterized protein (DUF305 family)
VRIPGPVTALAVALVLALGGCSSSDSPTRGKGFNDTDVGFAGDMIQHHAQALSMVDLTLGRDLDPQVARLADDIRAAQAPEIEKMAGWLQDWGKRVPPTSRDHAHADSHTQPEMDSDMPGMMSAEQMAALERAQGEKFQRLWLEMMIDHHEGAVEMARDETEGGENAKAVALAERIIRAQEKEISTMQELLKG